jgi:hypothetical protein
VCAGGLFGCLFLQFCKNLPGTTVSNLKIPCYSPVSETQFLSTKPPFLRPLPNVPVTSSCASVRPSVRLESRYTEFREIFYWVRSCQASNKFKSAWNRAKTTQCLCAFMTDSVNDVTMAVFVTTATSARGY